MKLDTNYINNYRFNQSLIADLNRDIQGLKRTGEKTQEIHRRSAQIIRYIHKAVDPLNANNVKGMGDDMNKATKGHYYDPKGSSGSPELLSYRAYEHTHDGQLRLHEHLDSSNLILPRGLSNEEISKITQSLQRSSQAEYLPAQYITEEQQSITNKIGRMFGIKPEELKRLTVDSFPDQLLRVINDSEQGLEKQENTILISPYSLSGLANNKLRQILGPNTSSSQDLKPNSAPSVLSVKGTNNLHANGELKASAEFNGIFDLNTNNFSPSIGGKAGSKEEEVFHETLNAAREKIKQDVSIIQKINDKAASKLALGMPSILRINPFKNN